MKTLWLKEMMGLVLVIVLTACSSMEYAVRERFGQHKRELLVERVGDAKESQVAAKEQFVDALTRFKAVSGFQGGVLEEQYELLHGEFKDCERRANEVHKRIAAVEDVARALFKEWSDELTQYTSQQLREGSEQRLEKTRRSADQLIASMRNAERRMTPVLNTFRDQVLFLKHNLNARAVASLGNVALELQQNINALVNDMERAIDEANRFIDSMQAEGPMS